MKRIEQIRGPLHGEMSVPGDKSIGHRAVIFASIAYGQSRIFNLSGGEDNQQTVQAFKDMEVKIWADGDLLCTEGNGRASLSKLREPIEFSNARTTMRV